MLTDYFDAYLAWDTAHGWHNLWGWDAWRVGPPSGVAEKLSHSLGDKAAMIAFFDGISKTLSAKYDKKAVEEGCIAPLKNAVVR